MTHPAGNPLKVHVHTLGCRLNQYESDSLESTFSAHGYGIVKDAAQADICVVNTCTITNKADRKTRNTISRLRKDMGIQGLLVLTGCFVENHQDFRADEEHTLLVGNQDKSRIFDLVESCLKGEITQKLPGTAFDFPQSGETRRARAFLKIQDGCDQFCTYCIVPHVRGRAQSRDPAETLENARTLLAQGYRELVLTGVNISRYRHPGSQEDTGFAGLIRQLLALEGNFRLRIASMEPDLCDQEFFSLFASPKLMPHLHLCLQSGSIGVLKAMGRSYRPEDFLETCRALRLVRPDFAISTDLICGFPGETEEEFLESLSFCRTAGFSKIHVFPYSRRQGTQADSLPGHLDHGIIMERARRAQALGRELEETFLKNWQGRPVEFICEKAWLDQDRIILEGHDPRFSRVQASLNPQPSRIGSFHADTWRKKLYTCTALGVSEDEDGLFLQGADARS